MDSKLIAIRNKVLASVVGMSEKPDTPVAFALHLLEVLDAADFAVLDHFEAASSEKEVLEFHLALMRDVGISEEVLQASVA